MVNVLKKGMVVALCMVMAAPMVNVKADTTEKYLALGADLKSSERTKVLELLDVDNVDEYQQIQVTNKEEHEYLGDYLSASVIGSRALSSVTVERTDDGDGIDVETENISYCTEEMYKNALATAGIEDADVKVAGPFNISGTAALVGVMKAYEEMTGNPIPEDAKDAATDELISTGELGESIGKENAAKIIADVKQKVVEDGLKTPEEIGDAIDESAKDLNIELTDAQKQQIQDLMDKISDLDLDVDKLKEQAQDIYDKLGGADGILDKISQWFDSVVNWFKSIFS